MLTATDKLQEYFNELMNFADTGVTSQEEQILLAGAMMGVAKMLYHNNLTEQEYDTVRAALGLEPISVAARKGQKITKNIRNNLLPEV